MTIRYNNELGHYVAQCDCCHDVVDFEDLTDFEDFEAAKFSIDLDGWQTRKKDGKWFNTCSDCVT